MSPEPHPDIIRPELQLDISHTDDPRVVEEQTGEEYTNHVVPLSARIDRRELLGGWSSIASAMAFVFYGALAAALVGVAQALIGVAITCVIFSLIARLGGARAIRNGLNSTLMSRELFGVKGAAICPLVVSIGCIFYAVFESSVLAAALQAYFGFGDIRVWYVVVIVGLFPLMLGGMQTWMGKLNAVSLPVYFFGLVAAVVAAGMRFGWDGDWTAFDAAPSSTGIPGWLTIVILYMGSWMTVQDLQDFARMSKPQDAKFHLNVTFGPVFWSVTFFFNAVVGILIVGLTAGQPGVAPTEVGAIQGVVAALGLIGLIVIIVSQARINTANFYFASISAERFVAHFTRRNLKRRTWVILANLVTLAVMFSNVFDYMTLALGWMGVLIAAWVGMQLVRFFHRRGTELEFRGGRLKNLSPGFYVWLGSTAIGLVLLEMPEQFPVLSALAPIVTSVIAVVAYAAILALGATAHRQERPDEIRERLADELWSARVRCHSCDKSYVAIEMDTTADQQRVHCLSCQTA